jgi:hypothetical protein
MKAFHLAILAVTTWQSLSAQDPARGEYRVPTTPNPLFRYTPISLISVTPTKKILALDNRGNILNGNGSAWQKLAGNLVQVSAGTDSEIWGVNANHAVFRWNGSTWVTMPGSLQQVAVARDGGLIMGIEAAPPNRIVRWAPNSSSWIPLDGAPAIVQLAIGSSNHVFGVTSIGEIFRLKRPEMTEWRRVQGVLKQISVGVDGTVGGIGFNGITYVRKDEDVAAEMENPNMSPGWAELAEPAKYIEVVRLDNVLLVDKHGMSVEAEPLAIGGLTITGSRLQVVTSQNDALTEIRNTAESRPVVDGGECIPINPNTELNMAQVQAQRLNTNATLVNFRCTTGKFSKIKISCAPKENPPAGQMLLNSSFYSGCNDRQAPPPPSPTGQTIDGQGTDCRPRMFYNRSAHTSVTFMLPGGRVGESVSIPAGAHSRYVFPACNRVVWDNLTFSCSASKEWALTSGRYDADGYCHGSPGSSPYVSISDRGYNDR